jgi:carbamoyltransferase
MGGCALNCSANPIAFKHFKDVWIMPAPGDNGSAIGAVLAHRRQHIKWPGPYLGYDMGYQASNEEIVEHLINHKACGVARGPAEFGPRALGNRSLLADPRDPEIRVLINQIKQREQFRPFAPAILEEFADSVFFMPIKSTTYMTFICEFRENGSYLSVRHHDNTARVQTVGPQDDPKFRHLLELWHQRTGCPMLLNTSLNIKGQPMVNDHKDAAAWWANYGLKVFN